MKLLLILILCLSLSSCDKAYDFVYENFSLQKNIDSADEEGRKELDGDFTIGDFSYKIMPSVSRFIENGFSPDASIDKNGLNDKTEMIKSANTMDIKLTNGISSFFIKVKNETSSPISIMDAPVTYINMSQADLGNMDFNLRGIRFGDTLSDMTAKMPGKEILSLREDSKNNQYYMYINGEYLAIFTLSQDKLSKIEIIPNDWFYDYEKRWNKIRIYKWLFIRNQNIK